MSKSRGTLPAHALPYRSPKPPPSKSKSTPTPPPPPPRRKGIYIASGLLLYTLTTYTVYLYWTLDVKSHPNDNILPLPDADVSSRYDTTAPHFDADVSFIERFSGINRLRKKLVEQAKGDVLEVCVGTGRNAVWYDVSNGGGGGGGQGGKVKSLTFVDQSGAMLDIARKKWRALHPEFEKVEFRQESVMDLLPSIPTPKDKKDPSLAISNINNNKSEGFTTILQTMGLCSTPHPTLALSHLSTLLHPTEGRFLLLEHGRSHYNLVNWILDRSAARHADRHGCWWNRDVGKVLEESGVRVERVERRQLGTLWVVEVRGKGKGRGEKEGVRKG